MKNLRNLDSAYEARCPVTGQPNQYGGIGCQGGWFNVPSCVDGVRLTVCASDAGGWDHVSVSRADRCPHWEEMCQIKDLFFEEFECAIQYHPPKSEYVNIHPHCLHIWSCLSGMPLPPKVMV